MIRTILALYEEFDDAEIVIEALLDAGFSHKDIAMMSRDHWFDETHVSNKQEYAWMQPIDGSEVLLQVQASGDQAQIARDMICNSGPIDVLERVKQWQEDWAVVSMTVDINETVSEDIT